MAGAHSADSRARAGGCSGYRSGPDCGYRAVPAMLRWPVAILLTGLGIRQFYRHLHPRWAAMRVGWAA